jgi:hypothetical protein
MISKLCSKKLQTTPKLCYRDLRFILVEPTRRSEEVQTILKLGEIGSTRAALNTAKNRLTTAKRHSLEEMTSAQGNAVIHFTSVFWSSSQ